MGSEQHGTNYIIKYDKSWYAKYKQTASGKRKSSHNLKLTNNILICLQCRIKPPGTRPTICLCSSLIQWFKLNSFIQSSYNVHGQINPLQYTIKISTWFKQYRHQQYLLWSVGVWERKVKDTTSCKDQWCVHFVSDYQKTDTEVVGNLILEKRADMCPSMYQAMLSSPQDDKE